MFWMTQSLLSSWIYFMGAEDPYIDQALDSILAVLRLEKREKTRAMLDGIRFERAINQTVGGLHVEDLPGEKWGMAVNRFAKICSGGTAQVPVSGRICVAGMDFALYGVCDYVKSGCIYDIKKVTRYEYGKYVKSPQHPMYMHMLPEAARFDYLIFDGSFCYKETYRRCDCKPVEQTISEFIRWLSDTGNMELYKANWSMNRKREELIDGI